MGKGVFRQTGHDPPQASIGQKHADPGAGKRQQQRFGQKLADDTKSARSHSGPDPELMLPRCAARQQQNGNIAASDSQQQPHSSEQQSKRPA